MENRGSADDVAKDSARAGGIQESDFAEEFSSDLPSTAMPSSAPSGSSPYASLSSPSAVKVDDRNVAHGAGRVGDTKKLEHALPTEPRMQLPAAGFGMVDSMGRPPVVYASNSDVGPGAFPVRSARNTATSRTVRSPVGSYANARELTNEESKQEDGVPNSAVAGIGVYAVEAQRVPDGNEDGTVLVAEAQYVRTKWYQRRWITLGLALLACGLVVVLVVVLVVRPPSAATSSSSSTSPPTVPITGAPSIPEVAKVPPTPVPSEDAPSTPEPTTAPPTTAPVTTAPATPDPTPPPPTFAPIAPISPTPKPISTALPTQAPTTRRPTTTSKPTPFLTPFGIACNFLSMFNVTKCRSTFVFDSDNGATTTGSTIPTEIGLLTQLTYLDIDSNSLSSTIPSELGLLTKLMYLDLWGNALTSAIPSEIGRLTQLGLLDFSGNRLTSSIPSEIGLLTQLTALYFSDNALKGTIPSSLCSLPSPPTIYIDCGEITCASGCCSCG